MTDPETGDVVEAGVRIVAGPLDPVDGGYEFDVTVSGSGGSALSVPDDEGGIGFGVYP